MVRIFILTLSIAMAWTLSASAQVSQAQLQSCLLRSAQGKDPAERDEAKFACIQRFNQTISVDRCEQIASTMEYTSTEDSIRKYCIFDLTANPTVSQCIRIAKNTEYGEHGDEIRWQCMRLLAPTSNVKDCLKLSKDMVLPHNKRRMIELCEISY